MLLVLSMALVIWTVGHFLNVPKAARWPMLGLLFVAVLMLHLVLPNGHPLRMATGESPAPWLLLAAAAGLAMAYRSVLGRVREKARAAQTAANAGAAPAPGAMQGTELNRYARHIMLREIGGPGQKAIKSARVLVIGAGGLGAPALQYLGAAGIGTLGVIDDDTVDGSNLHRQVIHRDHNIGEPKVFSATAALAAQNPFIDVRPYNRRLTGDIAADLFADYDIIVDGSDNFTTRHLSNAAAVRLGKPLVYGALTQWEGQLSLFDPARGGPCYACLFPAIPAEGLAPTCAEAGVIGPLPGVIGTMMALEVLKVITGAGAAMRGRLLLYDGLWGETRTITTQSRADCPICRSVQQEAAE